jgi:hypothetical protein
MHIEAFNSTQFNAAWRAMKEFNTAHGSNELIQHGTFEATN